MTNIKLETKFLFTSMDLSVEEEVSNRTFNQLFHIKYFLEFRSNINKYNLDMKLINLNIRNELFYSKINILCRLYFDDQNFDLKTIFNYIFN